MAVPVIRQQCQSAQVGIVLNFSPAYPASGSATDQTKTRQEHARLNLWFLNPIAGLGYPQVAWYGYGSDVPQVTPGDMKIITAPLDFLGVNYYSRQICHDPAGSEDSQILNELNKYDNRNLSLVRLLTTLEGREWAQRWKRRQTVLFV
jgi:beta-glucosidase/6-phospho-beta-glucosidase/beta-galactosidase